MGLPVEFQLAPQDRLVGSTLRRPQRVADEHNFRAKLFFIGRKTAPKFRADAESRNKIPGDGFSLDANGTVNASQSELGVVVRNQMVKSVVAAAPVKEVGIGQSSVT